MPDSESTIGLYVLGVLIVTLTLAVGVALVFYSWGLAVARVKSAYPAINEFRIVGVSRDGERRLTGNRGGYMLPQGFTSGLQAVEFAMNNRPLGRETHTFVVVTLPEAIAMVDYLNRNSPPIGGDE